MSRSRSEDGLIGVFNIVQAGVRRELADGTNTVQPAKEKRGAEKNSLVEILRGQRSKMQICLITRGVPSYID